MCLSLCWILCSLRQKTPSLPSHSKSPPPTAPCLLRASERNNAARRVVTEQGRQKDVLESTDSQVRGARIVHIV